MLKMLIYLNRILNFTNLSREVKQSIQKINIYSGILPDDVLSIFFCFVLHRYLIKVAELHQRSDNARGDLQLMRNPEEVTIWSTTRTLMMINYQNVDAITISDPSYLCKVYKVHSLNQLLVVSWNTSDRDASIFVFVTVKFLCRYLISILTYGISRN